MVAAHPGRTAVAANLDLGVEPELNRLARIAAEAEGHGGLPTGGQVLVGKPGCGRPGQRRQHLGKATQVLGNLLVRPQVRTSFSHTSARQTSRHVLWQALVRLLPACGLVGLGVGAPAAAPAPALGATRLSRLGAIQFDPSPGVAGRFVW